jgi:hypothetical protein
VPRHFESVNTKRQGRRYLHKVLSRYLSRLVIAIRSIPHGYSGSAIIAIEDNHLIADATLPRSTTASDVRRAVAALHDREARIKNRTLLGRSAQETPSQEGWYSGLGLRPPRLTRLALHRTPSTVCGISYRKGPNFPRRPVKMVVCCTEQNSRILPYQPAYCTYETKKAFMFS